ncbi:MAG: hypothetical protein Q8L49_05495 [Burkholderiaceae bacterium]|nr:hypothetical protein [Burkholderiaceae bacterium]
MTRVKARWVSLHALRNSFIAGPVGNRDREDFNSTLGKNGSVFSQTSTYTYFEGPNQGFTGHCIASARRLP